MPVDGMQLRRLVDSLREEITSLKASLQRTLLQVNEHDERLECTVSQTQLQVALLAKVRIITEF